LGEVFSEDMNPDDLDIEPDASETDSGDEPDADEEAEEIRGSAGEIEGYAEGFTYDELATAIHEADQPEAMAKATVETLRNLSQTDMFEKLVSGDAGRAVSEQYLSHLREKGISYLFAGADGSAIATTGSGDAAQPFLTVLVWCGSIPTHLIERRNNQKH
jgi:hypothetical protein